MIKFTTCAATFGLIASSTLAGGYVAPIVGVEPVIVEERPSSSRAGLIVPSLLLLAVAAAIASDDDAGGITVTPDPDDS